MKRCALVIADDKSFADWIGNHITTAWPKIVLETVSVKAAPMALDRIELARYQVIVARFNFDSVACLDACIFLMRVLAKSDRPEIIIVSDRLDKLNSARTTKLKEAICVAGHELSSQLLTSTFAELRERNCRTGSGSPDGAPVIPGYQIKAPITGTYYSTLYLAYSEALDRDVALKIRELHTDHAIANGNQSLKHEFHAMRKLSGRGVAEVYDYLEHNGLGCMAMEHFPRGTLGNLFATSGRGVSRVEYLLDVARAVREVHAAGFLHLDLKPNNVMVRDDGSVALIDFGIAIRILVGRFQRGLSCSLGSPYFMSPEQLRGDPLDERSDIYSFGAIFYRIFTGRVPFGGCSFDQIKAARMSREIPQLGGVLHHYQPVIDGTLANDPAHRFKSFDEVIDRIEYHRNTATGVLRRPDRPAVLELQQPVGMNATAGTA